VLPGDGSVNPATQLSKSQIRLLTKLPYTAPPSATPEGQQVINRLGTTPLQPNRVCDTHIDKLIKGRDPDNKRLNRGTRSRLHNKELLIAIIAEHMGHGNSVKPEWWTPRNRSRPAKRIEPTVK